MSFTVFKMSELEIKKQIIQEGKWGTKPYEYSECFMTVDRDGQVVEYSGPPYVLGNSENEFERILDMCLMTMHEEETAEFQVTSESPISFTINLLKLNFRGFIFEWGATKKFEIAQYHKDKGVELFKNERVKDSAYRFTKALKIILSVPIDVQEKPVIIDGLPLKKINNLKANLYNNMASCYLKKEAWGKVIEFCNKVFSFDKDNVKALYKIGVAFRYDKNYELAAKSFESLLKLEPNHEAAKQHLSFVKIKLKEADARVNTIVKKMFKDVTK